MLTPVRSLVGDVAGDCGPLLWGALLSGRTGGDRVIPASSPLLRSNRIESHESCCPSCVEGCGSVSQSLAEASSVSSCGLPASRSTMGINVFPSLVTVWLETCVAFPLLLPFERMSQKYFFPGLFLVDELWAERDFFLRLKSCRMAGAEATTIPRFCSNLMIVLEM